MRPLTATAQAAIVNRFGNEFINIIEIDVNGSPIRYADKDIDGIEGRITELGPIDDIIDISESGSSGEVRFALLDHDGQLKRIFVDFNDLEHTEMRIYQTVAGLDEADWFVIFRGHVSSPVSWDEGTHTLSMAGLSELNNLPFGFSAEEGQFPLIPSSVVGKAWPAVFGLALAYPALHLSNAVEGQTTCRLGILSGKNEHLSIPISQQDCSLGMSVATAFQQISFLNTAATAWQTGDAVDSASVQDKTSELIAQANQIRTQITTALGSRELREQCARDVRQQTITDAEAEVDDCPNNQVTISGGEDFPQAQVISLDINGATFRGVMNANVFTIHSRQYPENDEKAQVRGGIIRGNICKTPTPAQPFSFSMDVPDVVVPTPAFDPKSDVGLPRGSRTLVRRGFIICNLSTDGPAQNTPVLQPFSAPAGTRVTLSEDQPQVYIASITPGTVLRVQARRRLGGEVVKVDIPRTFWSTSTQTFGPITATLITLQKALTAVADQDYVDNEILVSFRSTVGPNTADVIEYIVDNYTSLTTDAASFAATHTLIATQPSGFVVLDRPNTIDLLKRICFEARLACFVKDSVFFLDYLAKDPDVDKVLIADDIMPNTIKIESVRSEDLFSRFVAEWRTDWSGDTEDKMVIESNQERLGDREFEVDYLIYNRPELVYLSLSFWAMRMSNNWKILSFQALPTLLELETFDTVEVQLPGLVADTNIKATVQEAVWDTASETYSMKVKTSVKFGTMEAYELYWPSANPAEYPLPTDNVGPAGIGKNVVGDLPGLGNITGVVAPNPRAKVFSGGPNTFHRQSSTGASDMSDPPSAPPEPLGDATLLIADGGDPIDPIVDLNFLEPAAPLELPDIPNFHSGGIDIRSTPIYDSRTKQTTTMSSFFQDVSPEKFLRMKTSAEITDNVFAGEFSFKFDADEEQWGASIAYLKDDA